MNIKQLKEHLIAVLDYNWKNELDDYNDHQGEECHIFHSLVALDQFVYGHDKTADDFVKDEQD